MLTPRISYTTSDKPERKRVQPDRCPECGKIPTICPTCGAYACRCPLPWLVQKDKQRRHRIIPRVHYDPTGRKYPVPEGFQDYPSEIEDEEWVKQLMEEDR